MSTSSITGSAASAASLAAPARRSLTNYRRLLAKSLNSLTLVTTTTAGNAGGTTLVAAELADAVDANRYRNCWVLGCESPILGEQRRVRDQDALNIASGALTVTRAFSAQVTSGTDVEIHRLLPAEDNDGWVGLRTCINRALAELWTTQRVALTGVEGQATYSVGVTSDWLDPEAIQEVYGAALAHDIPPMMNGGFAPYRDADTVNVDLAPLLASGEAAKLGVFRQGDTWIRVSGAWATSTTGLVNDSDEALFQPQFVVLVALVYAYEALAVGDNPGPWEAKAKQQRVAANVQKMMLLDHTQRRIGSGAMGWPVWDGKDPRTWY